MPKLSSIDRISSGIAHLDGLLDGLYIGDNVVWHDDAGSLASIFCLNLLQASQRQGRPLIYVCFDRPPRQLLEKLGPLADWPDLTLLDCFTHGKGASSEVFVKFYRSQATSPACRIIPVANPVNMQEVMHAFYDLHATMTGEVCFIFDSLTGMQELWHGEDEIVRFYAHSCPRLYELRTIAYWVIEKRAHSARVRAQINQIAQVAIELSIRRGKTALTVLKAERRGLETLGNPIHYWTRGMEVLFEQQSRGVGHGALGARLKALRTRRGLSQTELGRFVGVTASTISQVESDQIFPSIPALFKMAEALGVGAGAFFEPESEQPQPVILSAADATPLALPDLPRTALKAWRLLPVAAGTRPAEPYLVEIAPKKRLSAHFLRHKGGELGYLLAGNLQLLIEGERHQAGPGDLIQLNDQAPSQWYNPGPEPARLLWLALAD